MAETQVLAVCDVEQSRRDQSRGLVETQYGEAARSGTYRGCTAHNDFRELIARDDIDIVVVSTPDHWHALPVIAAAKAGKHIYCEKPLGLTVEEGRVMSDTVRRYGVVFQTGSQLRSGEGTRRACELVRNGYIGKLHTIRVGTPQSRTMPNQPEMPVPPGFDYDMWLGPAPREPYTPARCHGTFRFILDYSGGEITDHGAHYIDIGQWGHGSALSGPVEIEGEGEYPRDGLFNAAAKYEVRCTYADGVKMIITSEGEYGVIFEGTEGRIGVSDGGIRLAEPASLLSLVIRAEETHYYQSHGHHQNFLECIRTGAEPIAPIEQAHRTATVAHLGNIAMKLGRKLQWDPARERFVDDVTADRMLSRSMRSPWQL
jgi:predicted dehydrogenase